MDVLAFDVEHRTAPAHLLFLIQYNKAYELQSTLASNMYILWGGSSVYRRGAFINVMR